jgi:superfamily II DNA/RNA helicase
VALILAPTRELAEQIYTECFKYLRPFGLRVVPVLGGMQRYEQERSLAAGCEVVVATPGRLMELLSAGSASCSRVTFVVLDEADRMLSLGFEPAVRSILGQIRPDKQLCMFSATFDSRDARVEKLARQFLVRPLRIRVGEGEDGGSGSGTTANKSIRQVVDVLSSPEDKWSWLVSKLPSFLQVGAVLLFVSTIAGVESLVKRLQRHFHGRYSIGALHGDSHQAQRHAVLSSFKKGEVQLLVATDVASRGLDIKGLPTVVNVDPARGSDAHTHRIGRTGRAGREGVAYTLLAASETMDQRSAGMLLDSLEAADSEVPQALRELAEKDKAYMRSRNERIARTQKAAAARGGGRAGMVGGRGGAGAAASYNNVPPPSMHPPPPAGSAAAFPAGGLQGALAFANAYNSKSALPPHPVAPAATSFIGGQSGGAAVGGVHPSRLAQVPGALASAMAAAAAPANVGAAATLPLPPPPPPAAPMMGAAPSVQQVHPSRWSMVPNAQPQHSLPVPPPPPPPSSYPPSTATAYSLPLPPPPPPQVQPQAQTPAASTDGAAAAPPKRRSRWDVSS